jgi:serine/threonine protein kinase
MSDLELKPGQRLLGTPYEAVRVVGQGGMGIVYEVEHVRLKKRYMAKTLHPGLRSREDFLARMETEAQTLARIAHPNIVEVNDLGVTQDGIPYFIMEKLVGSDLRRLLRARRRLDVHDALPIMIDVLEALAHTHREGVIHRDIKPENIFLAQDGAETRTKILDFGIVHVMEGGKNLTEDRFIGTYQYASPEQISGEKVTERSDIYAVGCVLYELLTGRIPFCKLAVKDIAEAHLKEKPVPLSSVVNVAPELEGLVMMALEKDPARRPQSALWLARQLHRALAAAGQQDEPQALTTQETLLTAVTEARDSSPRVQNSPRTPPQDTDVDAAPPVPLDDTTPDGRAAFVSTELDPTPRPAAPKPAASPLRAAETRTAELPKHVPTEPLVESDPLSELERAIVSSGAHAPQLRSVEARLRRVWMTRVVVAAIGAACLVFAAMALWRRAEVGTSHPAPSAATVASTPAASPSASAPIASVESTPSAWATGSSVPPPPSQPPSAPPRPSARATTTAPSRHAEPPAPTGRSDLSRSF